ncbi:hypothetical protein M422DRAFT_254940 [Sphaerobolus stellatus SS14]|uniref:Uncharacterized protein n=1 Tax=Sphaerobolus stellatus (strain SS14) TaxID=990650 RepID=A0A0C9VTT6_SPHS4|nr:hypothetical protein M422DRAFT_254940 [Sphaerobolus stellatus SS14]
MSDPVKLFQIQTELLQTRQHRTGYLVHPHQQIKTVHLCNSRNDLEHFKYSFITPVDITGKRPIRFLATVDDGAGLCTIDSHIWNQWQKDFGNAVDSIVGAKVSSGHIIKSRGYIVLHVNVKGIACDTVFEILDSQGAFEILLGKPWLGLTRATRDYNEDTLKFIVGPVKIIIPNRTPKLPLAYMGPARDTSPTRTRLKRPPHYTRQRKTPSEHSDEPTHPTRPGTTKTAHNPIHTRPKLLPHYSRQHKTPSEHTDQPTHPTHPGTAQTAHNAHLINPKYPPATSKNIPWAHSTSQTTESRHTRDPRKHRKPQPIAECAHARQHPSHHTDLVQRRPFHACQQRRPRRPSFARTATSRRCTRHADADSPANVDRLRHPQA